MLFLRNSRVSIYCCQRSLGILRTSPNRPVSIAVYRSVMADLEQGRRVRSQSRDMQTRTRKSTRPLTYLSEIVQPLSISWAAVKTDFTEISLHMESLIRFCIL